MSLFNFLPLGPSCVEWPIKSLRKETKHLWNEHSSSSFIYTSVAIRCVSLSLALFYRVRHEMHNRECSTRAELLTVPLCLSCRIWRVTARFLIFVDSHTYHSAKRSNFSISNQLFILLRSTKTNLSPLLREPCILSSFLISAVAKERFFSCFCDRGLE